MLARGLGLVVAVAATGCLKSPEIQCDGFICPPGLLCDDARGRCVDPEQAGACADKVDGDPCTFGVVSDGVCADGLCVGRACGNGAVEGLEQCEPGNPVTPFSCLNFGFDYGHPTCLDNCDLDQTACRSIGLIPQVTGRTSNLNHVFGVSATDVFAVGSDGVMHFDGARWQSMASPPGLQLFGVWAGASDFAIAVGDQGTALHYDGTSWRLEPSNTTERLLAVWGFSPSDVYAVGLGGSIFHFDGSGWTQDEPLPGVPLQGVWGSGPSDLYAVGNGGTILHSTDGNAWTPQTSTTTEDLLGVWGSGGQVFAVGQNGVIVRSVDGSTWETPEDTGTLTLLGVFGVSPTDVIAVGEADFSDNERAIVRYDGQYWRPLLAANPDDLKSVWRASNGEVFAVGLDGVALHSSGTIISPPPTEFEAAEFEALAAVWADAEVAFVVGAGGSIGRFDGPSFAQVPWPPSPPAPPNADLHDVSGRSGSDVFMVGDAGTVLHYNGTTLDLTIEASAALRGVFAAPDGATFAVGDAGTIITRQAGAWEPMESGVQVSLAAVWASAGDDAFAVGEAGTIVHHDGSAWTPQSSGVSVALRGVWGASSSAVFAAGDAGVILRYDGGKWQPMVSNTTRDLLRVTGTSPSDVFAVGRDGAILHYDGMTWSPVRATARV